MSADYTVPTLDPAVVAANKESSINNAATNLVPILEKGEAEMAAKYTELSTMDPGAITQAVLLGVQMAMQRWQLVSQLLTAVIAGVGQALKATSQNIR